MSLLHEYEGRAVLFQVENKKFSHKLGAGTVWMLEPEPVEWQTFSDSGRSGHNHPPPHAQDLDTAAEAVANWCCKRLAAKRGLRVCDLHAVRVVAVGS